MENKFNIVLISNLYPLPNDAQRGIFIEQFVQRLKELCNITVICPLPYFPNIKILKIFSKWFSFATVPKKSIIKSVEVYYPKYILIPKISEKIHAFLMYKSLKDIVKKLTFKIDLINIHWIYPDGVAGSWISKKLKIPFILSARGCDINDSLYKPFMQHLILQALNSANAITTVSEDISLQIKKKLPMTNVLTIPNGVNHQLFTNNIRVKPSLSAKKTVLFIGQLVPVKGFVNLIYAVEMLVKNYSQQFQIIVIGDGEEKKKYTSLINDLKLTSYFIFKGFLPHKKVASYLQKSDLLCLPSIREGRPNAIIEALASGVPVVASNVGGIPELIIHGKNGLLVEKNNINDLTRQIEKALFQIKWDYNLINSTVKDLAWEKTAEKYFELYTSILNK